MALWPSLAFTKPEGISMRRARRRSKETAPKAPIPSGRHAGWTQPYQPLTPPDVSLIIDTALKLVATSGVIFEPGSEADDLLAGAGCEVKGDGLVLIPEEVSRWALERLYL